LAIDKTIKVCHIASGDLWAGAEVQMYTLLEALSLIPELTISAVVLNQGKLTEKLKGIGIDVTVLDESRYGFYRLRQMLIDTFRGKHIDLIHSHRYKENILAGSIKNKCNIKRLVQTVHGASEPHGGLASLKSRAYTVANRIMTRRYFDRIIAVSDDIRLQLIHHYPASKLQTIHNAVNPLKIRPVKTIEAVKCEFNIPVNAPIIGAIGRMVPIKAYDLFLGMAGEIFKTYPQARFMLIGDGPQKTLLQDMAAKMNIADRVIFPGFRDDIVDIINAFDIFVISSFHEGVPMALLEAMALKKAVVSTAVGGIKEVIQDGVSGLLVPSQAPQALSDACLRILGDDDLRHRLETAAARRVDEEFSIYTLRERVLRLYKEMVNSK
jgi:L-malate glycosyltransferase